MSRAIADIARFRNSAPVRRHLYPGTVVLFGVIIAMFFVELRAGGLGRDVVLLNLGALPDNGEIHSQYWRLVTFGLLHSDFTHILLNSALLMLAAPIIERRVGALYLLAVFATASIASGIGILAKHELWPTVGVSVGASGGAFGLLAAAVVLILRVDRERSVLLIALLATIAAGLVYSFLPGISMVGHIVGLATGTIVGFFIPLRANRSKGGTA